MVDAYFLTYNMQWEIIKERYIKHTKPNLEQQKTCRLEYTQIAKI